MMAESDNPDPDATARDSRAAPVRPDLLAGLAPATAQRLRNAGQYLLQGDLDRAEQELAAVVAEAPNHAQTLRMQGIVHQLRGRHDPAIAFLRRALALRPNDASMFNALGSALNGGGHHEQAIDAFRRACELDPKLASAWFNLGSTLLARAEFPEAEAAFARAAEFQSRDAMVRVGHADALVRLARIDEAVEEYRAALRIDGHCLLAWARLANLGSIRFDESDVESLRSLHAAAALSDHDRSTAGFALGKALEDTAQYDAAFGVLVAANAEQRRGSRWDAPVFSRHVDSITSAFATAAKTAGSSEIGSEAIFVVGMPRSGSALAAQILTAHAEVGSADEPPDLTLVIQEESARRKQAFPGWIGAATPADWERLGRRYLERTQHWRHARPRHLDGTLSNWILIGAVTAMLPAARIVNCRRDPVETCWSCFKQLFERGKQTFCYDLGDIAAYWVDYNRLMSFWHARHPGSLYDLAYENLVAEPEREVRALLEFCGLRFDPACLRSLGGRGVRGTGAAQAALVRNDGTSQHYGTLLDPLRRALRG